MLNRFRNLYARIALRRPFARRSWAKHMSIHMPIIEPALKGNPYALLLTLRTLDAVQNRKPSAAASRRLYKLHFYCLENHPEDRALYNFLCGMYSGMLGKADEMARRFRIATKFGHSYHLIYAMLGLYYLHDRRHYDRAETYLNQAIDCIYKYLPLDEVKQHAIATLQSSLSLALLMMHRTDEAQTLLEKAAAAANTTEHLHALAMLRAVQGRSTEAQDALAALRPHSEELWKLCKEHVQLLLEGSHPHFTPREPNHAAIAAYWEWFLQAESELLRNLSNDDSRACFQLHSPYFDPLAPESDHIDLMSVGFRATRGQPKILIHDRHSRNYAALLDAFTAACPKEILSRWEIVRNPDSDGTPHTHSSGAASTPPAASFSSEEQV